MNWPYAKLGEVCCPKQHPTISTAELTAEGYPAFGANGQIGFYKTFTHDQTTIAITCRGATCGTINVVPAYSYISGNAMALDNLDTDRANLQFLTHALRSRGLADVISGSAQPQITRGPLLGVRIPLPPLVEQHRIAAILDRADELRLKRRVSLASIHKLREATFIEMFGDPIRNDRGWQILSIEEFVAAFEGGKNLVAADDAENSFATHRVLKVSAIGSDGYDPTESKALPVGYIPPERHFVTKGDLLISRANTSELVGRVALVHETPNNVVLPDKIWRFVWRQPALTDPRFVEVLFRHPSTRYELGKLATGTSGSMKNISQGKLFKLRVAVPPLHLQKTFSSRMQCVEGLLFNCRTHLAKLDELFASLQHRAFDGELTLATVSAELEATG